MGLDITAYSRLKHIGNHTEGWCQDDKHIKAYVYPDFPASFRGIPVLDDARKLSGMTVLWGGCYVKTEATADHRFTTGTYFEYGGWRANLQAQFNPDQDSDLPFYELICFADNEGCIGPDAASDLLADFREHSGRYVPPATYSGAADLGYKDWACACELAADGGLIEFR